MQPMGQAGGQKMAETNGRAPRDQRRLARTVSATLVVYAATEAAMTVLSVVEVGRLMGGATELSIGGKMAYLATMISWLAASFAMAALSGIWFYRVNRNAAVLAADKSISPAWSIIWFFVPLANLVMPFKAMSETWRISLSPANWKDAPLPERVSFWWGLLLLSSFVNAFGGFPGETGADPGATLLGMELKALGSAMAVAAALLLRRIVGEISQAQAGAAPPTA